MTSPDSGSTCSSVPATCHATSSPTWSINSMGPIGMPKRMISRSSSRAELPSITIRTASPMYGNRTRFTRKPGESLVTTGVLPSFFTSFSNVNTVSSLVSLARTTSTRSMRCTGLKKCSPATRSARAVACAISPTDNADVLETITA